MRVPEPLSLAFGKPFEELITRFAVEQKLLPEQTALDSPRFLARSVVPHIQKLSELFNRLEPREEPDPDARPARPARPGMRPRRQPRKSNQAEGLGPYWN